MTTVTGTAGRNRRHNEGMTLGRRGSGVPWCWGATPEEVLARYRCDEVLPDAPGRWLRAVDSGADPQTLFRWLCQLRSAPYSYDWLDNFGRRSPRELQPWTAELAPGLPVMTIFTLESFIAAQQLTVRMRPGRATGVFGDLALTYQIGRRPDGGSRLVAAMRVADAPGLLGGVRREALAWGDLLMMRRQLQTLAELAATNS
jgi:hypothetical protein